MKATYYIIHTTMYLISLLPLWILYRISDGIYHIIYHIAKYRRPLVRKHLKDSFPEKSETEIIKIEKGFYSWFADYIVETIKLFSMSERQIRKRMKFKGTEELDICVANGQSCGIYLRTDIPRAGKQTVQQPVPPVAPTLRGRVHTDGRDTAPNSPVQTGQPTDCTRIYIGSGAVLEQHTPLARLPEPRYAGTHRYGEADALHKTSRFLCRRAPNTPRIL